MKLLKVIRNPITDHLPIDSIKYGTSFSSEALVKPEELVHPDKHVVIVVGAMAHGKVSICLNYS
jgi:rRNA small subunit pseudouridine methyltransferase Nep1